MTLNTIIHRTASSSLIYHALVKIIAEYRYNVDNSARGDAKEVIQ